jgi:hypothetical protein
MRMTEPGALPEALVECLRAVDCGQVQYAIVRNLVHDLPRRFKQALVFVKPELLHSGRDRGGILRTVITKLAEGGLSVGGAAVLGPARMGAVAAENYAVINRISRLGPRGLSRFALDALDRSYAAEIAAGTPILGAHQLMASSNVSLEELSTAWRTARSARLAPGTYAAVIQLRGRRVLALNGFHPEQLAHYTAYDARVVAFEVGWDSLSWREFRAQVIGATDPRDADPRSIRGYVRDNRAALGLAEVDRGRNGIHGSAGPLEAMMELSRFFAVPATETSFGALIPAHGDDPAGSGPGIGSVDRMPIADLHLLFEATEDCEPDEALRVIANRLRAAGGTPPR